MLDKVVELLNIKNNGVYVDATFGGGGHSMAILNKLETGKLIGFDQDADTKQNIIHNKKFIFINQNFRFLKNYLEFYKSIPVDGILADLGMSSYQIDNASKGFSYLHPDEMLDMRMNASSEITASDILNTYSVEDLQTIFYRYGEISFSNKLAKKIEQYRETNTIKKIHQLTDIVDEFVPGFKKYKTYSKVFQALRIEVNDELNSLSDFLTQAYEVLKSNGRLLVISYHSLEDRLVKNFFRSGNCDGRVEKDFYGNTTKYWKLITNKPITPDEEELKENQRSRSAKLRAAEKIGSL